jgi:hypothetical protein
MGVHKRSFDARCKDALEPVVEQSFPLDRHEAFWHRHRQRAESRTKTGCKENRAHSTT